MLPIDKSDITTHAHVRLLCCAVLCTSLLTFETLPPNISVRYSTRDHCTSTYTHVMR